MPPLLLLVLLLFPAADAYPSACSANAICGGRIIAYPFWLNSSSSPSCGYPGLGLSCESNTTLVLPVKSHRYEVLKIDYDTHTISLADSDVVDVDPTSCPFLHFNLTIDASSGLQLTVSDSSITFFYNCNKNYWQHSEAVELSGCPGYNNNRSSYVLPGGDAAATGIAAYERGCEAAVVAPVLDVHKQNMEDWPQAASFDKVLRGGFELKYTPSSEQCGGCEKSGGWCGYRQNLTHGGLGFTCFCEGGSAAADRCSGSKHKTIIAGNTYFFHTRDLLHELSEVL